MKHHETLRMRNDFYRFEVPQRLSVFIKHTEGLCIDVCSEVKKEK